MVLAGRGCFGFGWGLVWRFRFGVVLVKLVAVTGLCCWYFTFCCCFAFCLCELFGGLFWILIWLVRLFVVGGRHDCWIWCWELVGLVLGCLFDACGFRFRVCVDLDLLSLVGFA